MLKYQVEGLGEVCLYVNKGAVGEWEAYFDKSWIDILIGNPDTNPVSRALSGGLNAEKWFVLLHKCYEVACYRQRSKPEFTLNDFKAFIEGDVYTQMISEVWPKFQEVVEMTKVMEAIEKINKEADKVLKKKK